MIVIAIVGIMAAVAVPMYSDYVKRARTSEVPEMMKVVAGLQFAYYEDPNGGNGRYANGVGTLRFMTSFATHDDGIPIGDTDLSYENVDGKFWYMNAHNDLSCSPTNTTRVGIVSALPKVLADVPSDWQMGACMRTTKDFFHQ